MFLCESNDKKKKREIGGDRISYFFTIEKMMICDSPWIMYFKGWYR
jgi:hypothetical protein